MNENIGLRKKNQLQSSRGVLIMVSQHRMKTDCSQIGGRTLSKAIVTKDLIAVAYIYKLVHAIQNVPIQFLCCH